MRPTRSGQHHVGAERSKHVARAGTTRMRGQCSPEATYRVFSLLRSVKTDRGKRQNGWANVVFGWTTLPLSLDREAGGSEQPLDALLQLLTDHFEHLQLPITRCYLLLQRTLRHTNGRRRLHFYPLGQQPAQQFGQLGNGRAVERGLLQADIEVLPP